MKKLMSLILALAMAFAMCVPAFAAAPAPAPAGPQTNVTMNITKGNTYTLNVPASVTVTKEGFENLPIKVDSDNDMESTKKVTVTAASANSWKLKDGTKSVDYILVASSNATDTAVTSYDFAAADINPTNGKTQASGVYVTADNYKAADSGTYTDTITFTSEVKAASAAVELTDVFNEGTVWTIVVTDSEAKYELTFKTLANGFECTNVVSGGVSYPEYVKLSAATRNGSQLTFIFGNGGLTIDTAAKTYSMSGAFNFTFDSLVINGTDLVSQLTKA